MGTRGEGLGVRGGRGERGEEVNGYCTFQKIKINHKQTGM